MASKRQKSKAPKDPRMEVVDAALRLAAKRDWDRIGMSDIAKEAKISLAQVSQMFDGREDIVCAYIRRVDADVLEHFSSSGNERDQLFDVLMERFECLNKDRAALQSILKSSCTDPKQMVIAWPYTLKSMNWMLEACGIETMGLKGALRVAGLGAIYLWVLRVWLKDDSADMGKTMAVLDRALGRADQLAGMAGL